jgi:hypothetical protein
MARTISIEEIANGYVVRSRGDAGNGAVAFSGERSLARALEHARLYLLAPRESAGEASFPLLALTDTEMSALEPRKETPLTPTEAAVRPVDPCATTVRRVQWARPVPPPRFMPPPGA